MVVPFFWTVTACLFNAAVAVIPPNRLPPILEGGIIDPDVVLTGVGVSSGNIETFIGPYLPNPHCIVGFSETKPDAAITSDLVLSILQRDRPNITTPYDAGIIMTPGK